LFVQFERRFFPLSLKESLFLTILTAFRALDESHYNTSFEAKLFENQIICEP